MNTSNKPSIVLVHGAFANASGWEPVISLLLKEGYYVTAVENPLHSLEGDVANTRRTIQAQTGPTIVVGHSYGGSVITGAAAGQPQVKALVYVAGYMPDAGESLGELTAKFEAPPLLTALVPDAEGFITVDRSRLHEVFGADLPEARTDLLGITQKPLHQSAFSASLTETAWKEIPSYFVLPTDDLTIHPDLHRFCAERAKAEVAEVAASHAVFISHPELIVDVIRRAAEAYGAAE